MDYAKIPQYPPIADIIYLTDTESIKGLYRYKRTFEVTTKERPAEMDKDVLTDYIRELLGATGDNRVNTSVHE